MGVARRQRVAVVGAKIRPPTVIALVRERVNRTIVCTSCWSLSVKVSWKSSPKTTRKLLGRGRLANSSPAAPEAISTRASLTVRPKSTVLCGVESPVALRDQ